MDDYKKIATSAEVWAVIRARHHNDLVLYSTFSDVSCCGSSTRMDTSYALRGSDYPIMEARSTWRNEPSEPHKRLDEMHEYWLCVPVKNKE